MARFPLVPAHPSGAGVRRQRLIPAG